MGEGEEVQEGGREGGKEVGGREKECREVEADWKGAAAHHPGSL